MKSRNFILRATRHALRATLFALTMLLIQTAPLHAASMLDYCQTPPFIIGGVKPNLLLMIDNSASMYDLSYIAGTFTTPPTVSCTGGTITSTQESFCYDTTYDNTRTYKGYFDSTKKYKYNETPSDNGTTPGSNDKFTEEAFPASCAYGGTASYACINKSGVGTTGDPYKITGFYATGNFLNWLSTSKFDVQKEVLTGGKYDTASSLLIGESRGCNGRRFVKTDSGVTGVTFAMRGPSSTEPDYVNPDTQGGLSRIEIYIGTNPNMADCQCAIANWIGGNYGQASTDTKDCLNLSQSGATGNELATFNHSLQTCWKIKDNIADGATTEATLFQGVNTQDLKTACTNAFKNVCGSVSTSGSDHYCDNNTPSDAADDYLVSQVPLKITNENSGNWICTGYLTGISPYTHATPGFPYNAIQPDDNSGFLGKCPTFSKNNPNKLDVTWGDETCVKREILHYCYGAAVAEVVDPSEGAADTATTGNIPSVLMDSAVRSLGTPAGTFYVRVSLSPAPTGIIDDFKNNIRFGAMSFNCIGSATETTLKPICRSGSNLDAGKIIHHIGYVGGTADESVGNHSSGLINTIDSLVAESWTPFAEAYYNSIGYFARTNAYTASPGTSRTDLRINSTDFDGSKNPSQYRCQQNHILIISDGMSTADQHSSISSLSALYNDGDGQAGGSGSGWTATCPEFAGSKNLDDLAWLAKNRNIKTFSTSSASTTVPAESSESIKTRVVYTGSTSSATGECNPETLMKETALNGCGYSDSTNACYQRAEASNLETSLRNAFQAIAAQASSGTAASVLASGEGSGANLVQALFYPVRQQFGSTTIDPGITWTGSLKNLWYYMDPFFTNSVIMDDSTSDKILNLSNDCSISFTSSGGTTSAIQCGTTTIALDDISVLWETGTILHSRTWSDRKIYVYNGTSVSLLPDTISTGNALISLMQATGATDAIKANEATAIAQYVKGNDVKVCSTNKNICTSTADCTGGETCDAYRSRTVTIGSSNTWKLGDIISSTPKIVSWAPLNGYYKAYNDQSYKTFTESTTSGYTNRGMVFVGANDGMLHAFYLGKLELSGSWQTAPTVMKAKLLDPSSIGLGKEIWGFIPKNALPYLKYMADPNYCHIYSIDATPYVFDASINGDPGDPKTSSSWRTILIGGMKLGGACKDAASAYGVQTPAAGMGYSSYFALDITDTLAHPDNPTTYPPQLLWEFSDPTLGFSTTGPAVVRISAKTGGIPDKNKNGYWFVVFGSGPTGPIDTGSKQFKGFSDQQLKLFVFDVKQGPGTNNVNVTTITPSTAINYAFVGSLFGAPIDIHQNNPGASGFYQDDSIYFGYTQSEDTTPTSSTKWTKGGVLRLLTKEDPTPSNWALSTVISGIGPVTAAVAKLQNYKSGSEALWLYFGTGRYYYKIGTEIDNGDNPGTIYGVNDKCFTASGFKPTLTTPDSCPSAVSESDLGQATTAAGNSDPDGWYVTLDSCTDSTGTTVVTCSSASEVYKAERVIASPTASSIGAVFFATAKPSYDLCAYGGVTHLWALDFDTGGAVSSNLLMGKALIQVSTGSIEQVDLKTTFTQKDNRRSSIIGGGGIAVASPPVVVPPKAVKSTIHMRER